MKQFCLYILTTIIVVIFSAGASAQSIDTLCVKVASVFENISVGKGTSGLINMTDVISQIKDSKTEFVFRAFYRWAWVPDSADQYPNSIYEKQGYTYKHLIEAIQQIKDSIPEIQLCGGLAAQKLDSVEINDLSHDTLDIVQTWAMALDPQKWSIPVTKDSIQTYLTSLIPGIDFYPDITNTSYQSLLIDRAKKLINCGMDAIWIDGLYSQAKLMELLTGDVNHISVQESYDASTHIVDEIHIYGNSIGKYIYVGTWQENARTLPFSKPHLDFVTRTPKPYEVSNASLDPSRWNTIRDSVVNVFGNIPIIVFIDWGIEPSPMAIFSQQMDSLQQRVFIAKTDSFLYDRSLTFAYPLYGGTMGQSATVLSYGVSHVYSASAPEFATSDTIITLGIMKSPMPWYCNSTTSIFQNNLPDHNIKLRVFPNPASNTITVQYFTDKSENITLKIYNTIGQEMQVPHFNKTLPANNTVLLDVSVLNTGIYFLILESNGFAACSKIEIIK